jgi:hypothetical protein
VQRLGARARAGRVELGARVLREAARAARRGQVEGLPQRLACLAGPARSPQRRAQGG